MSSTSPDPSSGVPPATIESFILRARTLLERLCAQPSVAAQDTGMAEMADLMEDKLVEAGFATQRLSIEGAPPIIYGEQRGRSPFTLLLYDHYDVQPPEPLDLWQSEPFEPVEREGKLYARGASDDKGEIAARLAAIHALRHELGELPITIKWVIEGEEEIGSPHFGEIIAPHAELLRADGGLWEGTGFAPDDRPYLCLGFKGMLYVQLETQALARDAHSGTAPLLPSAAWRLVQALATLRTPEGHVRIPGFYDAVAAPSEALRAALADMPDRAPLLREQYGIDQLLNGVSGAALEEQASFSPTCNIAGLLSGYGGEGIKTVLPARAMAKIDFRLVPHQNPRAIVSALRAHLDAEGYTDVTLSVLGSCAPVTIPPDHAFVRRIAGIAEGFEGRRPVVTPLAGGTLPLLEALQRYVGVPGLAAPGDPLYWANGAHAPNEHIRLQDLERAVRFNVHLFRSLGDAATSA